METSTFNFIVSLFLVCVRLNTLRFHLLDKRSLPVNITNNVVAMETAPLALGILLLMSEGLEHVSLLAFTEYLLSFDQNLPFLLVFLVLIYYMTSPGLSWQLD